MEKRKTCQHCVSLNLSVIGINWIWVKLPVKKSIKNTKNEVINVFTNSASRGIVNQRDYFDKDIANQNNLLNYYVVDNNDFIYNPRISNYAPVGPISRSQPLQRRHSPLRLRHARLALRWRGLDDSGLVNADEIQPGDTLIMPATWGGCWSWTKKASKSASWR